MAATNNRLDLKINHFTADDVAGVEHLYALAQPGATLVAGSGNLPWKYRDYERHRYRTVVKMPSWGITADPSASLAPLLDNRRYVESIVAGVKIKAHQNFRLVATMNDDSSTFDLPEYIQSRLQPQILIDFPEREEELAILRENLPFSPDEILQYVTNFLQQAHASDENYTVRDGVNVARYALKLKRDTRQPDRVLLQAAVRAVLGEEALRYGIRR